MNMKAEIVKMIRKPSDAKQDSFGICMVCGNESKFLFNSWSIDPSLLKGWNDIDFSRSSLYRESMFCSFCNSNFRVRRLAQEIVMKYSPDCKSLLQLISTSEFAKLRILEINEVGSFGSFHSILKNHQNLVTTDYREEGPFGSVRNGKSIQDLENLTFADNEFDLVIHSDVLEHVPRVNRAKQEMFRVLSSKGSCIFTIPVNLNIKNSFNRVEYSDYGEKIYLEKKLYHGRGGGPFRLLPVREDYLEITSFGADAADVLSTPETSIVAKRDPDLLFPLGQDLVFVASKSD